MMYIKSNIIAGIIILTVFLIGLKYHNKYHNDRESFEVIISDSSSISEIFASNEAKLADPNLFPKSSNPNAKFKIIAEKKEIPVIPQNKELKIEKNCIKLTEIQTAAIEKVENIVYIYDPKVNICYAVIFGKSLDTKAVCVVPYENVKDVAIIINNKENQNGSN